MSDYMDDDWNEAQQLNREERYPGPDLFNCCEHCVPGTSVNPRSALYHEVNAHTDDEQCLHGCHDEPFAYRIEPDANDHATVWVGDRAVVADYEVGPEVWQLIRSYVSDNS